MSPSAPPVRFDELPSWFDQLPAPDRDAINRLRDETRPASSRLLPSEHGETMAEQLRFAEKMFLSAREPFSLLRLGDLDLGLLGGGYLPCQPGANLSNQFREAGYAPGAFPLRASLIRALRDDALVGVQQNWASCALETAWLLAMLGIPVPFPRAVEVHLPYALLVDGTLFSWLEGRRVLLVGHLAPRLAEAWRKPAFHEALEPFGRSARTTIAGAVPMGSREDGGAWRDFGAALDAARTADYDVALVACGATAKPLSYEISKAGKTALDVGFVFDALVGECQDQRVKRPILREAPFKDTVW
jgi:hypothetical protein